MEATTQATTQATTLANEGTQPRVSLQTSLEKRYLTVERDSRARNFAQ
jgi:hypothetical protein